MNLFSKRADKLAILSKIVEGRLTNHDVINLRKSREPIHLTLNLDGTDIPQTFNEPCYHIDIYEDSTTKCYWQYADGRIEEVDKVDNRL